MFSAKAAVLGVVVAVVAAGAVQAQSAPPIRKEVRELRRDVHELKADRVDLRKDKREVVVDKWTIRVSFTIEGPPHLELIVRLGLSALVVTHDQTEAMAMSDKILLLNFGQIEQQGTPDEMYNKPQTQFTAEFMGSNNHLPGTIAEVANGRALLAGEGFRLWGARRGGLKVGDKATGIIRLERTKMTPFPGENRVEAELVTAMFMGDRREHLFKLGELRLRCYGETSGADRWLELPADDLWLFPGSA